MLSLRRHPTYSIFLLALFSCASVSPGMRFPTAAPELKLKIQRFRLETQNSGSDDGWTAYSSENEREKLHIRQIRNVSPEKADELMASREKTIQDLFKPMVNPYFGVLDAAYQCRDKVLIRPPIQDSSTEKKQLYELFATRELLYGTCTESQEIFKSQYLVIYCKTFRTLYEIKYYYPKESASRFTPIANCTR